MTIKIIKRGLPPEERIIRATCQHCKSLLEFSLKDANVTHDQRDGSTAEVICPVCNKRAYGYF